MIKTDSGGNQLWARTFGGENNEYSSDIKQTQDGGYIYVGSIGGVNSDAYIVKTDNIGNPEWYNRFGGATSIDDGNSVIQTSDGSYIITGDTRRVGGTSYPSDIFLIKFGSMGDRLWYRIFANHNYCNGQSVQQTFDGGYIIAGSIYIFREDNNNAYLLKTDSSGFQQWSKSVEGNGEEYGYNVQQTIDGGFIVAGSKKYHSSGPSDVYLIKIESEILRFTSNNEPNVTPIVLPSSAFCLSTSPNPFNNSTTITFTLAEAGEISLKVYDIAGREIQDLGFGIWELGTHSVVWNAGDNASGVYFVRLTVDSGQSTVKKVVLIK